MQFFQKRLPMFRASVRRTAVDDTEVDEKEAAESLARFEANLRLIERGTIDPPGEDAEVGINIVSGGKLTGRPNQTPRVKRATLAELFDSYLAEYPKGAKEAKRGKPRKSVWPTCRWRLPSARPSAEGCSRSGRGCG